MLIENLKPKNWDDRRDLMIPGDQATTLTFCVEHIIALSNLAIKDHDAFFIALSGGSTPKAIFAKLTASPYKEMIHWDKFHLFWSDERTALPSDPDSNYYMAMQSGFSQMPIPEQQIHRMCAESHIQKQALLYEEQIVKTLKGKPFDLVMLGMGEDGHTASLFPGTEGLKETQRLVIANFVPQKNCWRMTFTYRTINEAQHIVIYVLGTSKQKTLKEVLNSSDNTYPIENVGTTSHKALWISDEAAAEGLSSKEDD